MTPRTALFAALLLGFSACSTRSPSAAPDVTDGDAHRLPTGVRLDPAGTSHDVGSFPLSMLPSPDGKYLIVLMNGWREQGLQVLDRVTGEVVQILDLPAVFLGMAFSPDGRSLYISGGNEDVVYRCGWSNDRATLADSVMLAPRAAKAAGKRYPAGIAISADGKTLYAAENLADSLAVVDIASGKVVKRFPTERYPYAVVRSPDGTVYVSAWNGWTVSVFARAADGTLEDRGRIPTARHPSALLLNRDGSRLFVASGSTDRVAVIDTKTLRNVELLKDPPPDNAAEGSTPDALALSSDETRLFVAEADNNAVAVFDLSSAASGSLAGRIPTGWYPSALVVSGDQLAVLNAKGKGSGPNPHLEQPDKRRTDRTNQYTLGQIAGTLEFVQSSELGAGRLPALTARVANANGWNATQGRRRYPPFEHVIYIIKENRTYDQVFGDLPQADGDSSLVFFPRRVSPNHHALAERFGVFDRFFVNAEVSPDGHEWSTAAYVTDYAEKTIPSNYSSRGRSYDYEGENRGAETSDDVAEAASGYLWDLASKAGITYRNYGEFVHLDFGSTKTAPGAYHGVKPKLQGHTSPAFPGFDLDIPDQHRVDVWLDELHEFERRGDLPALEIIRLPNDHTSGARAGEPTPRAYMADNDLALGRIIEALSHSAFWKSTVVFVLEDDAQAGPDHVDSHRSVLLSISPYSRGGVSHRFVNTTDVIATIEDVLHLGRMSQFDQFGRPLREIWSDTPDLTPYSALTPATPLRELNPRTGAMAEASRKLMLDVEDRSDDDLFNRILWRSMKGNRPYPGARRMSSLELARSK